MREWCASNHYILTRLFVDQARSGSTVVGRESFLDMIEHFRRPGCEETGLIIWSFSRFARNLEDSQFFKSDLRRRGYIVHSLKDSIPEGMHGKLIEAVVEWKDAIYLEDLARDIKRGLDHLVNVHHCMTGTPPVGYKRRQVQIGIHRDGTPRLASRWVIDKARAERVRQAFRLRAQGATYMEIHRATGLYDWWKSYSYMMHNPLYIGNLRRAGGLVPGFVEPLIDIDTWEAVQTINREIDSTWKHPRRRSSRFILSGLARCARCGAFLSGYSVQKNGRQYDYYRCNSVPHLCNPLFNASKEPLERAVLTNLAEFLGQPGQAEQLYSEQAERLAELETDSQPATGSIAAELAGISAKLDRLAAAIADAGHSPTLLAELRLLEERQALLANRLQAARAAPRTLSESEFKERLASLAQALLQAEPHEQRLALINLISDLQFWREGRELHGHIEIVISSSVLSPGNTTYTPKSQFDFTIARLRKSYSH